MHWVCSFIISMGSRQLLAFLFLTIGWKWTNWQEPTLITTWIHLRIVQPSSIRAIKINAFDDWLRDVREHDFHILLILFSPKKEQPFKLYLGRSLEKKGIISIRYWIQHVKIYRCGYYYNGGMDIITKFTEMAKAISWLSRKNDKYFFLKDWKPWMDFLMEEEKAGLMISGFGEEKESKRMRKRIRWQFCLPTLLSVE